MPVRRGHVAPQNTFLGTIIRKFEGQSKFSLSIYFAIVVLFCSCLNGQQLLTIFKFVACKENPGDKKGIPGRSRNVLDLEYRLPTWIIGWWACLGLSLGFFGGGGLGLFSHAISGSSFYRWLYPYCTDIEVISLTFFWTSEVAVKAECRILLPLQCLKYRLDLVLLWLLMLLIIIAFSK